MISVPYRDGIILAQYHHHFGYAWPSLKLSSVKSVSSDSLASVSPCIKPLADMFLPWQVVHISDHQKSLNRLARKENVVAVWQICRTLDTES